MRPDTSSTNEFHQGTSNGDTVLVAPGTYHEHAIDFGGKDIAVMGRDPQDPMVVAETVVDGDDLNRVFIFNSGDNETCVLSGLTITGGNGVDRGGGIRFIEFSKPSLIGNTITDNHANRGGGIQCGDHSNTRILYKVITSNTADDKGGGLICEHGSSPVIAYCTFSDNSADKAGGISASNTCAPIVVNCVLRNNAPYELLGGTIAVSYSNIEGGWNGVGNIDEDPRYVYPEKYDYRLLWESPCIDAGHPDFPDPDGTRSDMGAHFFDQNDYITIYVTPDTTEVAPGGSLGVTHTAINRWGQSETLSFLAQVAAPGGTLFNIIGPLQFTLPASSTLQVYRNHWIPGNSPVGTYEYQALIEEAPSTLYDRDSFRFEVID